MGAQGTIITAGVNAQDPFSNAGHGTLRLDDVLDAGRVDVLAPYMGEDPLAELEAVVKTGGVSSDGGKPLVPLLL